MCIDTLRREEIDPILYWYNPNIHPMKEYKMRKNTLVDYAKSVDAKLIIENEYGLRKFIEGIYPDFDNRCGFCYEIRLDQTAKFAAANGFDAFTSTLFVSPYQNHELMIKTAEAAANKYNIDFLHRDFRPFFKEGQEKARELELYMQKYCGCVFSEEDRYTKHKKGEK
jgi:predicted adenine nucleotide alpha hydrolase (AANH) superfamily ATPase